MQVQLGLICSCVYFLHVIFVTSFKTSIGRYKVTRRSEEIKSCASELLSKKEYIDHIRVNKETGRCEGFHGPWNEKKLTAGYEYAKLDYHKENFKPTKNIQLQVDLNYPAVFHTGTSYSLYVTWPQITWKMIQLSLYYRPGGKNNLQMRIYGVEKYLEVYESFGTVEPIEYAIMHDLHGSDCKISFVAIGNNSIQVLFNGESVATWRGGIACYDILGQSSLYYMHSSNDDRFRLHGTEYIQGNQGFADCIQ